MMKANQKGKGMLKTNVQLQHKEEWVVKEVIIFANIYSQDKCVGINCARDDDEKDAGIDFEIDSDHPRTDLVRWIWKTDILVTATDYEWNDDWEEMKKLPTKHFKLLSSFRAIGPLDS